MVGSAEDRQKFSDLCDAHGIDQPQWLNLTSIEAAFDFADQVGYPVLVRPSYVLSGAAMNGRWCRTSGYSRIKSSYTFFFDICSLSFTLLSLLSLRLSLLSSVAYSAGELAKHLAEAEEVSADKPVVITEFIEGGREIDVDAVADNGEVIAHAISEHVENAGIHSGDATLMLPTQTIPLEEMKLVRETIRKIGKQCWRGEWKVSIQSTFSTSDHTVANPDFFHCSPRVLCSHCVGNHRSFQHAIDCQRRAGENH